ncbi:MAG: DNA double-strand break repair nuclease NurA [Blastocatellia bacterium]|nr:DNA double-strand break repair nuclease NurA [Blastocatellia bacterium]
MNQEAPKDHQLTEEGTREDLQGRPHLLIALAENALTVAESLRDNYFANTARFITALRRRVHESGKHPRPILTVHKLENTEWSSVQGEVVTFIDGGFGRGQIASQAPILLRVGSYCVRTGERRISRREQFGYYPVILGDLEGGSKERPDFPDIVRITAELLGGLSALERTPDLRVLMFHGPLVYLMGIYAGHTPFTERDIDLFLRQYAKDPKLGRRIKQGFLSEAYKTIYPKMTRSSDEWAHKRLFEPLAWIAYLYRRLIREARKRNPVPIIAGVVERSQMREFSERVLLERVFQGLRKNDRLDYFNRMYGRTDLNSPRSLLDRLGYKDSLLLAMLLHPGEFSEPWEIAKYEGLHQADVYLPGRARPDRVDFEPLKPGPVGFPRVRGCYVCISETTEPVRVEVFDELGPAQIEEAARRTYLYSRLMPDYGFPVGLDTADKFAHVPAWMVEAYSKLIRYNLGVSLQRGEIDDREMRRILIQAIYMTHRDWLFRPRS